MGIEEALMGLADRMLDFDEASLVQLQEKYLKKVSEFEPTREWERSIIVYFLINSVRVKNKIFNEKVQNHQSPEPKRPAKSVLKRIK